MDNVFFHHQIKHNKNTGAWDKGIVVKDDPTKDNLEEAKQSYHAYLGAYAYKHDPTIDFVSCQVTNLSGTVLLEETWQEYIPEPEPNDEPEGEEV